MKHSAELTPAVLIMDSGVGGLSIVPHIRNYCPEQSLLYLADNAAFPYGDRDESWLIERVVQLACGLKERYPLRLLVLGCNTASTAVLPALRQILDIPVVGVVPAIKPAAAISQTGHIGLLATPGTVNRRYTRDLIETFASHCTVTAVGSTEVVRLAEEKLAGHVVDLQRLTEAVYPLFIPEALDTVVLGCTHFPLLKAELQQIAPRELQWVDSGEAIARRVRMLLSQDSDIQIKRSLSSSELDTGDLAFVTQSVPLGSALTGFMSDFGFRELHLLPL